MALSITSEQAFSKAFSEENQIEKIINREDWNLSDGKMLVVMVPFLHEQQVHH